MTTQADDEAEDATRPEAHHEVVTSATFGGVKFYLYQLVYTPTSKSDPLPQAWVVTGLNETLVLADLRFNETLTLTDDDVRNKRVSPQFSETDIPIFGY